MDYQTYFLLNDRRVCAVEHPGMSVLDYLRQIQRLTGTKEGCKEGDCGACAVLVGELDGERAHYRAMTSCLLPLGEIQGKHLVTIEGLNMDILSPVQQAIYDEGGSQCGFCTPGIVISLTGYLLEKGAAVDYDGMKTALGGHLCRCTGYSSLKRAARILVRLVQEWGPDIDIEALIERRAIPAYFREIPSRLRELPKGKSPIEETHGGTGPQIFIAGGTDIYVQKGDIIPQSKISLLNLHPEMKAISRRDGSIYIGALTTFEDFTHHPEIIKIVPNVADFGRQIASVQIRNRATLGGNIVNASPIGDMTILLLSLETTLVLKQSGTARNVSLRNFFKGYKDLDKAPSEILTEIVVSVPPEHTRIHFEKVSKRKYLDIASVNSAIRISADMEGTITDIGLSMGGVAPVPLFLKETCAYFIGKVVDRETILRAFPIVQKEISPISDVRGSADYKRLLARQSLISHFTGLFPESVKARDFYETL